MVELLNRGIARELQVSIQYMWQHVLVTGINSVAVEEIFRKTAITEMKHAEAIAERLAYLGGSPTIKPDPIFVGADLEEMLRMDVKAEEEAILLYKQTIKVADEEGDITTRRLFEEILGQEEEHHDTFSRLLVGMVGLSQPEL
ncbi:MAG: demethoxyubiquinone hydroxylase family protein [Candidatus Bathyarchaeota archaeon]|nr:demethoxyubiquinone hydroxylase family protein [Candidatus Bathyarchaeota archaeon]